jgi:hypothetical protein
VRAGGAGADGHCKVPPFFLLGVLRQKPLQGKAYATIRFSLSLEHLHPTHSAPSRSIAVQRTWETKSFIGMH